MARHALAWIFLTSFAACGLYQGAAEVTAPDGSTMPDATSDSMMFDAVPLPDAGESCDSGGTQGAILVLAGASGCPVGTMQENLVMNPTAANGACSCGACTPTVAPACTASNVLFSYGSNNNCVGGPNSYNVTEGACQAFGFTFTAVDYNRWTQVTPSAGTCTAATMPDMSKVTTTPLTRCIVPAMRPDILCGAEKLGGYKLCVPGGGGDAGCTGRFSQLVGAGASASLSCDTCACAHAATTCTIDYFSDVSCMAKTYTRSLDGQCTTTGNPQNNAYFKAYATGKTCTATPGQARVNLAGAVRMCCEP